MGYYAMNSDAPTNGKTKKENANGVDVNSSQKIKNKCSVINHANVHIMTIQENTLIRGIL